MRWLITIILLLPLKSRAELSCESLFTAPVEQTAEQTQKIETSPNVNAGLFAEFAAIADGDILSIPIFLERMVPVGTEGRFYFKKGDLQIRLTLKHEAGGKWSSANTAWDRLWADEDALHLPQELDALQNPTPKWYTPEQRLAVQMKEIAYAFMHRQVDASLPKLRAQWTKAMPDFARGRELTLLLVKSQGLRYSFAKGDFIPLAKPSELSPAEKKIVAAIQYLIKTDETYSPNKSDAFKSDFATYLFATLEQRGLHYQDGQWGTQND